MTKAPQINGAILFADTADMLRALGLADPDPAFTKLYHAAHIENANRDADAAWERVKAHTQVMAARGRA